MYLGRLLTMINFALLAVAIAIYFVDPTIATTFLYILIAWMFASLILFYLPISRRQIGRSSTAPAGPSAPPATGAPTASGGLPLPSAAASAASAPAASSASASTTAGPIGFCIYCGSHLPPNAEFCPACGHPVHAI